MVLLYAETQLPTFRVGLPPSLTVWETSEVKLINLTLVVVGDQPHLNACEVVGPEVERMRPTTGVKKAVPYRTGSEGRNMSVSTEQCHKQNQKSKIEQSLENSLLRMGAAALVWQFVV